MWLQGTYDPPKPVAEAFQSPNSRMFSSLPPFVATKPPETSCVENHHTADIIDLSTGDDGQDTNGNDVNNIGGDLDCSGANIDLNLPETNNNNGDDSKNESSGGSMDISNKDREEDDSGSVEGAALLPSFRKEYEKSTYDSLKVLYTEAFKFPYKEVTVGGRVVQLDSFHYVDSSNACQPEYNNKRAKKFELIARGEQVFIYRWEIKACLLVCLRKVRTTLVQVYVYF